MATINKEELIKFLAEQTGKEVDEIELGDDDLNKLYDPEEEEDFEGEEEEDIDDEDEEDDEDDDIDDDEEDDDEFGQDIDESKLDDTSRMIYNALLKEKERNRKKEIMNIIDVSGLKDQHKAVLKRMAKNGSKKKDIESSINDLLELEKSTKRKRKTTLIVPKGKVSGKKKKRTEPKVGTREYGAFLAKKLNKK